MAFFQKDHTLHTYAKEMTPTDDIKITNDRLIIDIQTKEDISFPFM